jgi:hypothetical protein
VNQERRERKMLTRKRLLKKKSRSISMAPGGGGQTALPYWESQSILTGVFLPLTILGETHGTCAGFWGAREAWLFEIRGSVLKHATEIFDRFTQLNMNLKHEPWRRLDNLQDPVQSQGQIPARQVPYFIELSVNLLVAAINPISQMGS